MIEKTKLILHVPLLGFHECGMVQASKSQRELEDYFPTIIHAEVIFKYLFRPKTSVLITLQMGGSSFANRVSYLYD